MRLVGFGSAHFLFVLFVSVLIDLCEAVLCEPFCYAYLVLFCFVLLRYVAGEVLRFLVPPVVSCV